MRPVGAADFLALMRFCAPLESLPRPIVEFLMSTFWIVPLRIWLVVMMVAATALPVQAMTRAVIEMASAGLGGRSFIRVLPWFWILLEHLQPSARCGDPSPG